MTQKFMRNYRLTIYPPNSSTPIIITMPLTINFSLIRNITSQQNNIDIQIFNLSEEHRSQIYQDWYAFGNPLQVINQSSGLPIGNDNFILEAGYRNSLYRIFSGVTWRASSAREGTNIVTKISAFANNTDIVSTQTYKTVQSGQTLAQILQSLVSEFPNLTLGNTLNYPNVFSRPVALNGNVFNLLKQYCGASAIFVDNNKIYILRDSEALNNTFEISDATGILETPRREQGALYVTMLFEPGIQCGQIVQINSTVQANFNGLYRVNAITHRGMISAAVCGRLVTILELLAPNQINGFASVNQL